MAKSISYCTVDGCEKRVKGHGLCQTHYMRVLRRSPEQLDELRRQPLPDAGPCSVDNCERIAAHLGLCNMHYLRKYRHGTTDERQRPKREPKPPVPCLIDGCDERATAKGLCRIHYARQYNKQKYVPSVRQSTEERFWEKVDRRGPNDCWNWKSATTNGYGTFGSVYKDDKGWHGVPAHRFAYELLIGPIPVGSHLHHRCENKACVNPAHLEPITPNDHFLTTMIQTIRAKGHTVVELSHD